MVGSSLGILVSGVLLGALSLGLIGLFRRRDISLSVVLSAAYIQGMVVLHVWSATGNDGQSLADPDNSSFAKLSQPFVSLVLVGPDAEQAASKWSDEAPKSLIKEVLVHGQKAPTAEYTIFVNAAADPVGDSFLAYLVRDLMITPKDAKTVIVPIVKVDGIELSHAVLYGHTSTRKFLEPQLKDVWVLPEFGALAVRTQFADELVSRILEGHVTAGSQDVWHCGGNIQLASLAKMNIRESLPQTSNGKLPMCTDPLSEETIRHKFRDYAMPLDDKAVFRITLGEQCLSFSPSLKPVLDVCTANKKEQSFAFFDGGKAIRSVLSCEAPGAPPCLCLDVGQTPKIGHKLTFYFCKVGNHSQQFQVGNKRLTWGSYCVDENLMMAHCTDALDQKLNVAVSQN